MKDRIKGISLMLVMVRNLRLVYYPHQKLASVASSVLLTDAALTAQLLSMANKLILCSGLGLAGPQIGCNKRIFIMGAPGSPRFFINPKAILRAPSDHTIPEGCLSIPNVYRQMLRSKWIRARLVLFGGTGLIKERVRVVNRGFVGMLSACFQHEIDHLDGRLILLA